MGQVIKFEDLKKLKQKGRVRLDKESTGKAALRLWKIARRAHPLRIGGEK